MPNHAETRVLPYGAQQMYDLVADVESYPQFLPWNSAARIRSRSPGPDGSEVIEADLVIKALGFDPDELPRLWETRRGANGRSDEGVALALSLRERVG